MEDGVMVEWVWDGLFELGGTMMFFTSGTCRSKLGFAGRDRGFLSFELCTD